MPNRNRGEAPPPPPEKAPVRRAVPLRTARDARKLLGRLVNEVRRDEIDAQKASRIGYLIGIYLKSVETDELAQRLERIEKRLGGQA
jgi:hypothetical protein